MIVISLSQWLFHFQDPLVIFLASSATALLGPQSLVKGAAGFPCLLLLQENGSDFLDTKLKAEFTKEIIDKRDFIKI